MLRVFDCLLMQLCFLCTNERKIIKKKKGEKENPGHQGKWEKGKGLTGARTGSNAQRQGNHW